MIDTDFIIKYTDALYDADPSVSPTYEEFRDMFSSGQIASKTWLAQELARLNLNISSFCICGSWYGTLAFYLNKIFPSASISCLDIDPRCSDFLKTLTRRSGDSWLSTVQADMFNYRFEEEAIINTSCEHIENLSLWLKKIPKNKIVILQSTDFKNAKDHVSTVSSIESFQSQTTEAFKSILFTGRLKLPVYNRYMIIGLT